MSDISTPNIVEEKLIKDVWPGPNSGIEDFIGRYSSTADQKKFHVDYLKESFRDFARPNLYKVEFHFGNTPRNDGSFLSLDSTEKTEFLVKQVNIPSFEISKQEIKRMGQRIVLPASQTYPDLQMTFMCDDDYTPRKFLHAWTKRLVYDTDYNYYKKVKTMSKADIVIKQLDNQFNCVFACLFSKCWCNNIGEIQLSHDSDSQVVEFPAVFCYSTYTILSNNMDDF